jgi:hypothetical protein
MAVFMTLFAFTGVAFGATELPSKYERAPLKSWLLQYDFCNDRYEYLTDPPCTFEGCVHQPCKATSDFTTLPLENEVVVKDISYLPQNAEIRSEFKNVSMNIQTDLEVMGSSVNVFDMAQSVEGDEKGDFFFMVGTTSYPKGLIVGGNELSRGSFAFITAVHKSFDMSRLRVFNEPKDYGSLGYNYSTYGSVVAIDLGSKRNLVCVSGSIAHVEARCIRFNLNSVEFEGAGFTLDSFDNAMEMAHFEHEDVNYLILGGHHKEMKILRIGNNDSLSEVSTVGLDPDSSKVNVNDIKVLGDRAFVTWNYGGPAYTSPTSARLSILNLSNPNSVSVIYTQEDFAHGSTEAEMIEVVIVPTRFIPHPMENRGYMMVIGGTWRTSVNDQWMKQMFSVLEIHERVNVVQGVTDSVTLISKEISIIGEEEEGLVRAFYDLSLDKNNMVVYAAARFPFGFDRFLFHDGKIELDETFAHDEKGVKLLVEATGDKMTLVKHLSLGTAEGVGSLAASFVELVPASEEEAIADEPEAVLDEDAELEEAAESTTVTGEAAEGEGAASAPTEKKGCSLVMGSNISGIDLLAVLFFVFALLPVAICRKRLIVDTPGQLD